MKAENFKEIEESKTPDAELSIKVYGDDVDMALYGNESVLLAALITCMENVETREIFDSALQIIKPSNIEFQFEKEDTTQYLS